jgi:hypothetical protein
MVLVDLPGYGFAKRAKHEKSRWGVLIEGYLSTRVTLRGVVLIVDVRRGVEAEEHELIEQIKTLPLKEFEFHQFRGKRRTISFGWKYNFNQRELQKADDIPEFLRPLRSRRSGRCKRSPRATATAQPSALCGAARGGNSSTYR